MHVNVHGDFGECVIYVVGACYLIGIEHGRDGLSCMRKASSAECLVDV